MHPQITVVTIGVFDLDRAKQFYADGLGCPISADHGVFVSFDLGGGSLLGGARSRPRRASTRLAPASRA